MRRNIHSLLFAAALLLMITGSSCRKEKQSYETIPVAGLFSLTGNWSSLGITSKAAIEIAVEEINSDFEARDIPFRFSASVYDTQLDTLKALQAIQSAWNSGIRMVVGPQSSAEVSALKSFADTSDMLVVSQGSTASTLAIKLDAIFRYCPGDAIEGAALARSIYNEGKRGLVTVARDDAGNVGLQNAVKGSFQALGGTTENLVAYPTTTTDFTTVLNDIKTRITTLAAVHGIANVGVYLASFDEAVLLFHQAAGDSLLQSVNWYGGDGFIRSAALLTDTTACSFAVATSFYSPEFGLPTSAQSKWQPLRAAIQSRCGQQPDAFALAAYDAVWVMARSIEASGGVPPIGANLRNSFMAQTGFYSGATGSILLNDKGDRSNGTFDYWGLQNNGGAYSWVFVGTSQ
jgi:branched-chain amino acid transport system substrate-binding protein